MLYIVLLAFVARYALCVLYISFACLCGLLSTLLALYLFCLPFWLAFFLVACADGALWFKIQVYPRTHYMGQNYINRSRTKSMVFDEKPHRTGWFGWLHVSATLWSCFCSEVGRDIGQVERFAAIRSVSVEMHRYDNVYGRLQIGMPPSKEGKNIEQTCGPDRSGSRFSRRSHHWVTMAMIRPGACVWHTSHSGLKTQLKVWASRWDGAVQLTSSALQQRGSGAGVGCVKRQDSKWTC